MSIELKEEDYESLKNEITNIMLIEDIQDTIESNKMLIDKQRKNTVFEIDEEKNFKILNKDYYDYECAVLGGQLFTFLYNDEYDELELNPFLNSKKERFFLFKDVIYKVKLLNTEKTDTQFKVVYKVLVKHDTKPIDFSSIATSIVNELKIKGISL